MVETQVGIEHQSHSGLELLKDISMWVPNPGLTRGRKKQYFSSIVLHWKMKILLGLVLKDKQEDNIFSSLENIK